MPKSSFGLPILLSAVLVAVLGTACSPSNAKCTEARIPGGGAAPAGPTGPIKIVRVAVDPPDAVVFVGGERIDHPPGFVQLPGPIGYRFAVEVRSGSERIAKQVVITEQGPVPASLAFPGAAPPPPIPPNEGDVAARELMNDPFNAAAKARYEQNAEEARQREARRLLDAAMEGGHRGPEGQSLSVACFPVCEHVVIDGRDLGPSPVRHAAGPGKHTAKLTAGTVTRVIDVSMGAGESHSVHVDMRQARPQ